MEQDHSRAVLCNLQYQTDTARGTIRMRKRHFIEMTCVSRYNHSKYLPPVLYRCNAAFTVLADPKLRLESFVMIEVAAFFRRSTYRRCMRPICRWNSHSGHHRFLLMIGLLSDWSRISMRRRFLACRSLRLFRYLFH